MEIKPQNFFIGVVDFFSVILPGALITYFLMGIINDSLFGDNKVFALLGSEAAKWIAFLITTYIIGNLIFVVASLLLDQLIYDKLLRNIFFKKNFDLSYHAATNIRDEYVPTSSLLNQIISSGKLKPEEVVKLFSKPKQEIINTYKWSQVFLAFKNPGIIDEVKKLEADSKFFRSLVIAFLIIGFVLLFGNEGGDITISISVFVLALLSLYRYGDLRYKSTEKAYELIITINHFDKLQVDNKTKSESDFNIRTPATGKKTESIQSRILGLKRGYNVDTETIVISSHDKWTHSDISTKENIIVLEGKCIARVKEENAQVRDHFLSSNALLGLSPRSTLEITNNQPEPLIFLIAK
jgi:hypothetical protein